jgi:membrane protein DedA with SNARE-associated domain
MMPSLGSVIETYGYGAVALVVALECVGIPLPGEIILIAAAAYAGSSGHLHIAGVIAAAAAGAFAGNLAGFAIGRRYGYPLLLRFGRYAGLNDSRIKIGQYLFLRYGMLVVTLSRFVAVLRSVSGILAGTNRMDVQPFIIANAIGAGIWAVAYGALAFALDDEIHKLTGPIGAAIGLVLVAAAFGVARLLMRREAQLAADAERALPGPLHVDRAGLDAPNSKL